MKNTYIAIVVLVLIVLGFWVWGMNGKQTQAPSVSSTTETTPAPSAGTPATTDSNTSANANVNVSIGTTPVKEFTVTGQNFSFTPSTITVNKGDKVKITFKNTSGFHDFKIDEFGVAAPQAKSPNTSVLEFTANKTGSFQYYCSVGSHRSMGMWGTLTVK